MIFQIFYRSPQFRPKGLSLFLSARSGHLQLAALYLKIFHLPILIGKLGFIGRLGFLRSRYQLLRFCAGGLQFAVPLGQMIFEDRNGSLQFCLDGLGFFSVSCQRLFQLAALYLKIFTS